MASAFEIVVLGAREAGPIHPAELPQKDNKLGSGPDDAVALH